MQFVTKKHTNFIAFIFILISFVFSVWAKEGGKTGRTKLSSTPGCTCHGASPSTDVTVTISGPDSLAPGESAAYRIEINGGPLNAAGTDIAVSSGQLAPVDQSLRMENGELTHPSPKTPVNEVVRFDFNFTAPGTEGMVTMAANGNSVNGNHSTSGDKWNFADSKTITVKAVTALGTPAPIAAHGFRLEQNYPNPFNPQTQIRYRLKQAGFVILQIYNLSGQKIAQPVHRMQTAGLHHVTFNAENLPSGVYLYRLSTATGSVTKRMLLLK